MPLVSCRSSSNFDSLPRSARGKNAAINRINVSSAPPSPLPNPAKSAETAEGDAELSKGERGIHGNQGSLYDFGMSQGSTLVNGGSIGAPASDGVFTTMQRSNSMLSRRGSTQSKRALKVSSAALSRRAPPVSSDSFHFVSSDLGSPASGDEQKAGIRSIHSIDYGDEDDAMRSKLRREQAMQSRASHDGTMSRRTMSLDPNNAATPLSDLFPASVDSSPTRRSQPFSIRKKAISGPSKPANGQGKQGESLSSVTSVYTGAGAAVAGQPAKKRAVNKALIGLPTNFQHTGHIGASSYAAAAQVVDAQALKNSMAEVTAALRFDDIGMSLASGSQSVPMLLQQQRPEAEAGTNAFLPGFGLDAIEEEAARIATLKLQRQNHDELTRILKEAADGPRSDRSGTDVSNAGSPRLPASFRESLLEAAAPSARMRESSVASSSGATVVGASIADSEQSKSRVGVSRGHKQSNSVSSLASKRSNSSLDGKSSPPTTVVPLVYSGVTRNHSLSKRQGPSATNNIIRNAELARTGSSRHVQPERVPTGHVEMPARPISSVRPMLIESDHSMLAAAHDSAGALPDAKALADAGQSSPASGPGPNKPRRKPVPRPLDTDNRVNGENLAYTTDKSTTSSTTPPLSIAIPPAAQSETLPPSGPSNLSLPAADEGALQGTINRALIRRMQASVDEEPTAPLPAMPLVEGPSGNLITSTANLRWNSALKEITKALAADDQGQEGQLGLQQGLKAADEALARLGCI